MVVGVDDSPSVIPAKGEGRILCIRSLEPRVGTEPLAGWAGAVLEIAPSAGLPPVGPPLVAGLEPDIFRNGDALDLQGTRGEVELHDVAEVRVVTAFLERPDGRVLLLRRSDRVGSFQGRWAGVSGFLEEPTALAQARREVQEETGVDLARVEPVAAGSVVYARDGDRVYVVAPFRFLVRSPEVRLDWEHSEFAWVDPAEIGRRVTVPKLNRAWAAVRPARVPGGSPNP